MRAFASLGSLVAGLVAGLLLGYLIGMLMAAMLRDSLGWRNIFFLTGGLGILLSGAGAPRDLDRRAGARGDSRKDVAHDAHVSATPIWKTATASSHAMASCMTTPTPVQRVPIWRFWAASVATHGV